MCPSAPISAPHEIDTRATDEELVLYLGGRRIGDPIPSNVITEVNPFSVEPWDSPDDIWYLYNLKGPKSPKGEIEIKAIGAGYWKSVGQDLRILTATGTIVGRKTTREFYIGQAPYGHITGWMMHQYQTEQQDCSSLYRFFQYPNQRPNYEEQHNPVGADDTHEDYIVSVMLGLVEGEERNSASQDSTNRSQVANRDQQMPLPLSSKSLQDPAPDNSAQDGHATFDFSKGDYLELNDLCGSELSSSSSDNSSRMTLNSDEYFDVDALLQDIDNESSLDVEEEHVDYRFVSASVKPNQVLIRLPQPGSVRSNRSNGVVEQTLPSTSIPANGSVSNPALSSSAVKPHQKGKAATSGLHRGTETNVALSDSSQGGESSQTLGKKPVGSISKLGRKYCCFAPF